MSVDKTIADLLDAMKANTEATRAKTEALKLNTATLERVLEGQAAALAKISAKDGGTETGAPRETAAQKKKREAAEAAAAAGTTTTETPATTTSTDAAATATTGTTENQVVAPEIAMLAVPQDNSTVDGPKGPEPSGQWRAGDFSEQQVKGEFLGWLASAPDAEKRKEQSAFLMSIGQHFGVSKPFGPEGMKTDEQRQKALFFMRRKRANLPVDFKADYDFAGEPEQGPKAAATAPAEEVDELG